MRAQIFWFLSRVNAFCYTFIKYYSTTLIRTCKFIKALTHQILLVFYFKKAVRASDDNAGLCHFSPTSLLLLVETSVRREEKSRKCVQSVSGPRRISFRCRFFSYSPLSLRSSFSRKILLVRCIVAERRRRASSSDFDLAAMRASDI